MNEREADFTAELLFVIEQLLECVIKFSKDAYTAAEKKSI